MINKKKKPLLTIGIPTFNRSKILKELLNDLSDRVLEHNGNIEIFVSDNASTDHTSNIVNSYISNNPYIRLHSNQENVGFDANVNNVMKLSKGEYVWLLGDDDYVLNESLDYIISAIKQNSDVSYILINYRSRFDKDHSIPSSLDLEHEINIFSHNEFFTNVKTASSLLSANIYKRVYWDFEKSAIYLGSGFIHLLMISNIILSKTAMVIHKVLVEQRASKDSVLINTGSSGAELEVNYEHPAINEYHKYPKVFWSFDINVKLRKILISDLKLLGYDDESIRSIDLSTQIETMRQSIYLKRYGNPYSYKDLFALVKLTFLEYRNRYIFWLLTLPILIFPRKFFRKIADFLIKILGSRVRLDNIF